MVLIGRLVKDGIVTKLKKDDRKVGNFTLAINDSYKPRNSEKIVSIRAFVNRSYWISPKIADCLTKGSLVEITGRLSVSAYNDMQGEAKGALNCHVDTIKIHQQKREVKEGLPF